MEKLYNVCTEKKFINVTETLKRKGYVWATDFSKEPTFEECKAFYHKNSKLLIHTFFNPLNGKNEMCVTTMSVLKTYPQYKNVKIKIEEMPNWKEFCKRIIATNGNPSTKDAEECGISFSAWFEFSTRNTSDQLVKNAKDVLKRMEVK